MSSLPIPSSLESFLATVRTLQSPGPPGPSASSAADQNVGSSSSSSAGHFALGELSEFASRSLDLLQRAPINNLVNAVDTLDGSQHSLGVAVLLTACLRQHQNIADWDGIFNRINIFIADCSAEQVRYAPGCFAEMCHIFADELLRRGRPLLGLLPLSRAVAKLQPNVNTLTGVHSDLCKLSLASKCFSLALGIIRRPEEFAEVAKESGGGGGGGGSGSSNSGGNSSAAADVKYILLYFYYAGMILAAVKEFSKALYYFEVCVTMPATAVSHIMLEAYKKFLLISLIHQGHKPKESLNLPKYTSSVVSKYFKQLSSPYNELVTAFYSNKPEELQAVVAKHAEIFSQDQNSGLVQQVQAAQTKTNVMRLTKTFLTLSMGELAARIGLGTPAEAERLLVNMIQDGCIHARISQKDGMVRFDSNPSDHFNTIPVLEMIETNLSRCISLDQKIASLDEEIVLNSSYIKKSHAASAAAASTSSASSSSAAAAAAAAASTVMDEDGGMKVNGGGSNSAASSSNSKNVTANGIGMF